MTSDHLIDAIGIGLHYMQMKEKEMTWKTSIPELIKTLVAGVECEVDGGLQGYYFVRFENRVFKAAWVRGGSEMGSKYSKTAWIRGCSEMGSKYSFHDVTRWRPARPKVENIDVRESYNGLWSFYTGKARVYIEEKPDLQRIQTLDKDRDYSGAKVQYYPYPRDAAKVGRINVSIHYDHVSISFMHVRCNWSGAKCPSMASVAAVYPEMDFSEAYFIVSE